MQRKRMCLIRAGTMLAAALTPLAARSAHAATLTGSLYFTTSQIENPSTLQVYQDAAVDQVGFSYDATAGTFSLSSISQIADLGAGSDAAGLIVGPSGNLFVAGASAGTIQQITPAGAAVGSVTVGGTTPTHLTLSPGGSTIYSGGSSAGDAPGTVGVTPIFSNGTSHAPAGAVTGVTQIAFDAAGQAYYTASPAAGSGSFGTIDLTTFTTTQTLGNLPAAHGVAFDSFTGDLILVGANHVTQVDPATSQVVSDLTLAPGTQLDNVASDGAGHLFITANGSVNTSTGTGTDGDLIFVDITKGGLVNAASTFESVTSLALGLNGLAIAASSDGSAPSSPPVTAVPTPAAVWMGLTLLIPLAAGACWLRWRRRN